ncbi:MAG: hypothetical protein QOD32_2855, partial [Pyrinomonadaceae bacterium]|nr:hypothetical protein [Pyrinomonadaceae bacterium]
MQLTTDYGQLTMNSLSHETNRSKTRENLKARASAGMLATVSAMPAKAVAKRRTRARR